MEDPSILTHKDLADMAASEYGMRTITVTRRVAGHLLLLRKATWNRIRMGVKSRTADKKILGIDTRISYQVLNAGLKIRLMKGIYILHYLRMKEGMNYKQHLQ
jgi:hypothetical protein